MASLESLHQILPEPFRSWPNHMDYKGQQLAERIFQVLITVCSVVGLVWGYVEQRFSYTVYCTLFGFFLSCLLVLPPWPAFRIDKNLKWQAVLEEKKPHDDQASTENSKNAKKKN